MTQPTRFAHPASTAAALPEERASVLLGPSPAVAQLWSQVRRLAPYVRTVLLTGEAGCGQEVVARLLLQLSADRQRRFVELPAGEIDARLLRPASFAALPQDAFVFIPDLENLSREGQATLLHLLRFRRSRSFSVVAASATELATLVGTEQFAPELAEVLGAVRLVMPALRQRKEDLPMLLTHQLGAECAKEGHTAPNLNEGLLRAALQHSWPGNLTELKTVAARLAVRAKASELYASDLLNCLPNPQVGQPDGSAKTGPARLIPLEIVMQEHVHAVLRACRGNKQRASEVLGISRSTLYRMLDTASNPRTLSLAS